MLGSDPDWSGEDNRARVLMQTTPASPDKTTYNQLFDGKTSVSLPNSHGVFTVSYALAFIGACECECRLIIRVIS